jgi:hypothetical protein
LIYWGIWANDRCDERLSDKRVAFLRSQLLEKVVQPCLLVLEFYKALFPDFEPFPNPSFH